MTTQKDVAEKAGVTVTTVSRVINNRGYISEETRKKVYQVMDELNYRPNAVARSLSKKKSNVLGVILPDVKHPFFSSLLSYIEEFAYKHDYKIMICNSKMKAEKEKEYINMLRAQQVDGIFASSDLIAAAVLKEAEKNRIKVPEDLKVIGYDDLELAELLNPEITTIRQPAAEIARKSVKLLLKAIDGQKINRKNILDVELIIRESA